jgi:hypothetical protein
LKIKYKARHSTRKTNGSAADSAVNIAETPEALLLAAVIRQAVEDAGHTPDSVAFHKHRSYAGYLARSGEDAIRFFENGLEDFLEHFGVAGIFHADTIRRGVRRVHNLETVEPAPSNTEIPGWSPVLLIELCGGQKPKHDTYRESRGGQQ